jgi:hypothetical protein
MTVATANVHRGGLLGGIDMTRQHAPSAGRVP